MTGIRGTVVILPFGQHCIPRYSVTLARNDPSSTSPRDPSPRNSSHEPTPSQSRFLLCRLLMPARKVVVGDGPQLEEYRRSFPDVQFVGAVDHGSLPEYYGRADVFVFSSKTDTYGLVMLEALACGTPVAAYPVNGAMDLADNHTVFVDEDLDVAVTSALHHADYSRCRSRADGRTWEESATRLCSNLVFQRVQ